MEHLFLSKRRIFKNYVVLIILEGFKKKNKGRFSVPFDTRFGVGRLTDKKRKEAGNDSRKSDRNSGRIE